MRTFGTRWPLVKNFDVLQVQNLGHAFIQIEILLEAGIIEGV